MGWRGQDNRDLEEERRWRELPLRDRYDWPGIAMVVVGLATIGALMWVFR